MAKAIFSNGFVAEEREEIVYEHRHKVWLVLSVCDKVNYRMVS